MTKFYVENRFQCWSNFSITVQHFCIIFIAYLVSTYQIWLCLPFKLLSEVGCFSDQNSDGISRRILKSFTSPTEEVDTCGLDVIKTPVKKADDSEILQEF